MHLQKQTLFQSAVAMAEHRLEKLRQEWADTQATDPTNGHRLASLGKEIDEAEGLLRDANSVLNGT